MTAVHPKHFARPPYSAEPSGGDNDWWYVANSQGVNCLAFPAKPGAKFTTENHARQLATEWNNT